VRQTRFFDEANRRKFAIVEIVIPILRRGSSFSSIAVAQKTLPPEPLCSFHNARETLALAEAVLAATMQV
jgi:hypothetical protein